MKQYPINKDASLSSEVIGTLSLKDRFAEKLDNVLLDFSIGYYESDNNEKKLINIYLIPRRIQPERISKRKVR